MRRLYGLRGDTFVFSPGFGPTVIKNILCAKENKNMLTEKRMADYMAILEEELLLATGCTEPIAVAYCAAKLRTVLGGKPTEIDAEISGNILKNVKSVVVPNTGGRRGIAAAIAVGIVAGDAEAELQVLARVTEEDVAAIQTYLDATPIKVTCPETPCMLDIKLTGRLEGHTATVRVANNHTNIIYMAKDGQVLLEKPLRGDAEDNLHDKSGLNVKDIVTFAQTVPLETIRPLISRQIACNSAIAKECIENSWGSNIGSNLLLENDAPETQARAWAAAGSDARMNGCEMPVVIVSGSGNQGITASVPVWRYGTIKGKSEEQILRAVCLSDLITIHQKTGIGRLSAYCGAVSAGVGAGCGIAFLNGEGYEGISHTLQNAVAMISGTICDGAKASCASKIAMGVGCGILGYNMYRTENNFRAGDGIVGTDEEDTIKNVGTLAAQGMRQTDRTILKIMTGE